MQVENNPGIVREADDGLDAGLAGDTLMDNGAPYNLHDKPAVIDPSFQDIMGFENEAMPESETMMPAPIAAGTTAEAASNLVSRIKGAHSMSKASGHWIYAPTSRMVRPGTLMFGPTSNWRER